MSEPIPRCIECGGPVNSLNEDEEGVPCPACAERLLETLPGVFHTPWTRSTTAEPDGIDAAEPDTASASAEPVDEPWSASRSEPRPMGGDDLSGDAS